MAKGTRTWVGLLGASAACALLGCFGDDNGHDAAAPEAGGPADATTDTATDAAPPDATGDARSDSSGGDATMDAGADAPSGDATPSAEGGDGAAEAGCPKSTCTSIEVKFVGWVPAADGGRATCEIRVDDAAPDGGTVYLTATANDPAAAGRNTLVGNFVTGADGGLASPLQYSNDNNACDVPDFIGRRNAYYLSVGQPLFIQPSYGKTCSCGGGNCPNACDDAGTGGVCDFTNGFYSQSCPNFGFNCVSTPQRIEQIEALATSADPTCELCIYDSTDAAPAHLVKCIAAGKSASKVDLVADGGGMAFPALVRLDDGTNCAAY
ncbi:MAG TPA: hypothetical protein VKU41_22240 [Polyangiaceae bacterium]|nr:hypothetical protein [Polyangiaceae bacterium]